MAKKITSSLLAALLTAGLLSPAFASEPKIGYVNTDRIIRDAPAAIKTGKKLEQEFGQRDQELKRLAADIQSRQEALEKNSLTLSEKEVRARERDINEMVRDFQRRQQAFQEDLTARQNEEGSTLIEKANRAIKRIAEAENYDVILQEATWVGASLDITGKVIQMLGEEN